MDDRLTAVVDEGLGNSAYLLDLGGGRALAVDPSLDLRAVAKAAARRGLRIAYAAETHLHADFLSGVRQLTHDHGGLVLASAAGARTYEHVGLGDGDEVDLGGLTLRALATPGHTAEHLSYVVLDGARPVGVFTGGSLMVGAAGRTDLVDPDRTEELARAQFHSLRRLATLPDATKVWPTHGAGSFCSTPAGDQRISDVATEKATNPLLAAADEDAFVASMLGGLGSYPTYFARLSEPNRHGPLWTDEPTLAPLDPVQLRRLLSQGTVLIDVRPVADYAAGHIRGSVSIPLRAHFATWLGWLLPPDVPLVILRNADQPADDISWPARNIGYTTIVGELAGGFAAWIADGEPIVTTPTIAPAGLSAAASVVDVRQHSEHAAGHLPYARLIELGDLTRFAGTVPDGPTTVMCAHGERAATAASLLERAGLDDVSILDGGPSEWAAATGNALVGA